MQVYRKPTFFTPWRKSVNHELPHEVENEVIWYKLLYNNLFSFNYVYFLFLHVTLILFNFTFKRSWSGVISK